MNAAIPNKNFQSIGEEIANSISHGIGLLAALSATPALITVCVQRSSASAVVASSIFGATMIMMYLMSTLYHALPCRSAKQVFRVLDHCAIYLLIAGTYTPICLVMLGGGWGWSLFGLIWGLAIMGILIRTLGGMRFKQLSIIIYVIMGWLVIIAMKPLWQQISPGGMAWLVAGGLAYSFGLGFYAASRLRYHHFIWHLFVIAGSVCHFMTVLLHVL
jgi:hemolysin III